MNMKETTRLDHPISVRLRRTGNTRFENRVGNVAGFLPFLCSLILLFALASPMSLRARQEPSPGIYEGQQVSEIHLIGPPTLDVSQFRDQLKLQEGQPYSYSRVQETLAALKATGQFDELDLNVIPEKEGLRVNFISSAAFYIGTFDFPGALAHFNYPQLLAVINYPVQEPYEKSSVEQKSQALKRFFEQNGFFMAEVTPESNIDEAKKLVNVNYRANLGRRARFGNVHVTGVSPEQARDFEAALHSIRARIHGADVRRGKPFDRNHIRAARQYLRDRLGNLDYLTSQIEVPNPEYSEETGTADITFRVTVGPTVIVRTTGAKVSRKQLRTLLPIYEENSLDQDLINLGARNLLSHFQSKGFFEVQVTSSLEQNQVQSTLTYQITAGKKRRVESVAITGAPDLNQDEIKKLVLVKKARLFTRGRFDSDLLLQSIKRVEAYSRDRGYLEAKAAPLVSDMGSRIDVVFNIKEGPKTIVDSVQVEGNDTQNIVALLANGLEIQEGRPYSPSAVNRDRSKIAASYLNLGYLNSSVRPEVNPVGEETTHVTVRYVVQEGPRVRVAQVLYSGAVHSHAKLLERTADIYPEHDLAERKLLDAESKLYGLGIFDWTNVSPRRPIAEQTSEDTIVRMHEGRRNSLTYGFGFKSTSRSGGLSSGTLILPGLPSLALPPTFKIIEKPIISPLGSIEYSRLNLRGHAETASVSALIWRLDQRLAFTYSDPYFRGWNWSSLFTASFERNTQNPLFAARLGLGSLQMEKVLDAMRTRRLQLRYTLQRTTLSHLLALNLIPDSDLKTVLSTVSATFIRDTRDQPLDAHKGFYQTVDFQFSPKAFGSSDNVVRLFGQMSYYRAVQPWLIWANNIRYGLVAPFAGSHVPFSQRFFSGGADSLRGFTLNGAGDQSIALLCLSESDPTTCTAKVAVPVGGQQLFIFNSELRFPIHAPFTDRLGGAVFYDGGNVYQKISLPSLARDYSNTIGIGLRLRTPVGPIRVDFGHNLSPPPGTKGNHFFVTLGQSF
jgi:outer membrane protein insertion porin family